MAAREQTDVSPLAAAWSWRMELVLLVAVLGGRAVARKASRKRRALAMIAAGATYTAAAAVIGAPEPTVWRWAHKAA